MFKKIIALNAALSMLLATPAMCGTNIYAEAYIGSDDQSAVSTEQNGDDHENLLSSGTDDVPAAGAPTETDAAMPTDTNSVYSAVPYSESGNGWTFDDTTGTLTITSDSGMFARRYNSQIVNVVIENGVTSICIEAFYYCSNLTSITIPGSVQSIGDSAFNNCTSLTSVTIPDSVQSIDRWAFYGCSSLTSITIPDGVQSIGDNTFCGCSSLTSVTIPDSVQSIDEDAFSGCSNLTSVTIPEGVQSIGKDAFYGCSSLTSITIPDGVQSIGNYTFSGCSSLTSVTIPDSVQSIGGYAFIGCSSLRSVTIPDGVQSIGSAAFSGCSSLTSITIPDGVQSIGSNTFDNCTSLTSVTIPDGVQSIGSLAFGHCSSLTSVTIPDSVQSIDSFAFGYCSSLTSVTIPDSVQSIGYGAFSGCSSLTSVTIPGSVRSIGDSAFRRCTSLTSIYIPAGTSIAAEAIPETSAQVKYEVNGGSVTVTDIILGTSQTSVVIPDFIAGFPVTSVSAEHRDKVSKSGHDHRYGEYVPDNNATCTDNGTKTRTCSICSETDTVTDNENTATGHSFSDYIPDGNATCTADGTKTRTCSICGETDTITDEGSRKAHNFSEGVCVVCGVSDPDYSKPSETTPPETTPARPPVPSIPNTPSNSTAAVSKEPFISGDSGQTGWEAILNDIINTPDSGAVKVNMNGTTELPKNILSTIQGKDIDLVLDMGGGFVWTVNGKDVKNPKAVNMGVRKSTRKIPVDVINTVSGESYTIELSLEHDGDFGFTAYLTVNLGKKNDGLFANLFHYNKTLGEMEFSCCDEIRNGKAELVFTHASEWLITVDGSPVFEDVSSAAAAHSSGEPIDASNCADIGRNPICPIEDKKLKISSRKRRYRILKIER